MPRKAVITAAGLGTRLLPMTKELPKEMLPIVVRGENGLMLKPLLQALFEQLYEFGLREFCFVIGRGKRSIEDHFTPDRPFLNKLGDKGARVTGTLEAFYEMVESSTIVFVNQPEPKGFGHAVLMAKPFVGSDPFMVCAGDTYIASRHNHFLKRMSEAFEEDTAAVLLLQEVEDPRKYGVAITRSHGRGLHRIMGVVEKPERPPTNLAIMPFYLFRPQIMGVLEGQRPGLGGEIQLTDAIQALIERGQGVVGILLEGDELRLDLGTPESYLEALNLSYQHSLRSQATNP